MIEYLKFKVGLGNEKKNFGILIRYFSSLEFLVLINNWYGEGLRCFVFLFILIFVSNFLFFLLFLV